MGPNDPYTRAALEAGRHEERKQIAMIDTLHLSATALLGFEGAAAALLDTKNWWDTASMYLLFLSILTLILNLFGVNMGKPWRRDRVGGVTPEMLDRWLRWGPDTLEDHLFIATLEAMRTNKTAQIKGRERTLSIAVVILVAAAACRGFGAMSG
ncbi:hypothetical protein ABZ419_09785 [Streptomyces cinnamoneus]|uniref:hypothetical protein n=1 Tax=Streptomyces cinnamoneus TaxID=53446 RepID=UPI0033C80402